VTSTSVEVPPEYRDIGFSGEFWLDAATDTPLLWGRMVPCLLGNSGWMALRVNDDNTVTVVRKDNAAIWEAFTSKPGSKTVPRLIPLGAEDWITSPPRYTVAHQLRQDAEGRVCHDTTRCGQRVRGRIVRAPSNMPRCRGCTKRRPPRKASP
jgi:hypothetical protein